MSGNGAGPGVNSDGKGVLCFLLANVFLAQYRSSIDRARHCSRLGWSCNVGNTRSGYENKCDYELDESDFPCPRAELRRSPGVVSTTSWQPSVYRLEVVKLGLLDVDIPALCLCAIVADSVETSI